MNNVIDLTQRLAKQKAKKAKPAGTVAPVIDMTEKRNAILLAERREVRRTILSEFVGAAALIPRKGLLKVNLYDISNEGLAFDVPVEAGHFSKGEEIAMRVYLNQQNYFSFVVRVQNIRAVPDEDVYRHGVSFVKDTINDVALHHFVKFIETVSTSLQSDAGDIMVSTIAR